MNALEKDIRTVFNHPDVSTSCLEHFLDNQHRFIRGKYQTPDGNGCFMKILTETLPEDKQITCKNDLIRFFGQAHGTPGTDNYVPAHESEEYMPAKYIVRMVDRHICPNIIERYGMEARQLSEEIYTMAVDVCRQVIDERQEEQVTMTESRKPAHQPAELVTTS